MRHSAPQQLEPSPARRGCTRCPTDLIPAVLLAVLAAAALCTCKERRVVAGFPDSFVGVGIELTMVNDQPVVVAVTPGGAAHEAGVRVGDAIRAVDGVSVAGLTLGDVVMRIRGDPATQVTLTVLRNGKDTIVVVRRKAMTKTKGTYVPSDAPKR